MNKQMSNPMKTGKYMSVLIAGTLLAASAQAQDRFWSAGSGDGSDAAGYHAAN
jgi:hypothetical protein